MTTLWKLSLAVAAACFDKPMRLSRFIHSRVVTSTAEIIHSGNSHPQGHLCCTKLPYIESILVGVYLWHIAERTSHRGGWPSGRSVRADKYVATMSRHMVAKLHHCSTHHCETASTSLRTTAHCCIQKSCSSLRAPQRKGAQSLAHIIVLVALHAQSHQAGTLLHMHRYSTLVHTTDHTTRRH